MPVARIPRSLPIHVHKTRDGNSDAHLKAIRLLPCAAYGTAGPSDPHHLMRVDTGRRGTGFRNADRWAIPLSRKAHDELHTGKEAIQLGEEAWLASKGVMGRELALALWACRDGEQADYDRIMSRHFQEQRLRRLTTGRGE